MSLFQHAQQQSVAPSTSGVASSSTTAGPDNSAMQVPPGGGDCELDPSQDRLERHLAFLTEGTLDTDLDGVRSVVTQLQDQALVPRDKDAVGGLLGDAAGLFRGVEDTVDAAEEDAQACESTDEGVQKLAGRVLALSSAARRSAASALKAVAADVAVPGGRSQVSFEEAPSVALALEVEPLEKDVELADWAIAYLGVHEGEAHHAKNVEAVSGEFNAKRATARYMIDGIYDMDAPPHSVLAELITTAGLSTADFSLQLEEQFDWKVAGDLQSVDIDELNTCVERAAEVAKSMKGMNDQSDPPGKLQVDGSKYKTVEAGRLIVDLVRVHNHMVDHYQTLSDIRGRDDGMATPDEQELLQSAARDTYLRWSAAQEDIDGAIKAITARGADAMRLDEGAAVRALTDFETNESILGAVVTDKLDEMDANILIELGAQASIQDNMLVAPDAATQIKGAAQAAARVAELDETLGKEVKGLVMSGAVDFSGVPKAAAFIAFAKLVRDKDSPSKVLEKAQAAGVLTASDAVDFGKAANELAMHGKNVAQGMCEVAAGALELAAKSAKSGGDEALAMVRTNVSTDLRFAAGKLGAVKGVGDLLSAVGAVFVLVDKSASDAQRADAAMDLAGAASGIAFTAAEMVGMTGAAAGGTAASFGLAYVQVLRHEFQRIAAVEERARANLGESAMGDIMTEAKQALAATARAAAASQLFKDQEAAAEQTSTAIAAKGAERHRRMLDKAYECHIELMDEIDQVLKADVHGVLVGYGADAKRLKKAFYDKADKGSTYIREGRKLGTDRGLAWGAPHVFDGMASMIEAFGELSGD